MSTNCLKITKTTMAFSKPNTNVNKTCNPVSLTIEKHCFNLQKALLTTIKLQNIYMYLIMYHLT